jgi:murein DD-endopeptidase MepM/ murein hydrolase activator NlpD
MLQCTSPDGPTRTRFVVLAAMLAILGGILAGSGVRAAADVGSRAAAEGAGIAELTGRGWVWPMPSFRLERPYEAPADRFARGHRGVDLRSLAGFDIHAPAAGVVAFSGSVAGRGILTIDHGDGLVTTLEPIETSLTAGTAVAHGAPIGSVALGGHTAAGALHFGVRLHGEYINPMLLLGGVPRAVLLPCC